VAALGVAVPAIAPQSLADASGAAGGAPILHEYVPYDPTTDGDLGAVTIEGGFAAELQTRSGKITAPDVGAPIVPGKTPIYGTKSAVPDSSFIADRDTKRIDSLPYDDPFRPSLAPFKRLAAFDGVDASFTLQVKGTYRSTVDVGKEVSPKEPVDPFYADVALDLKAGEPVRIPTPIAGAIVRKAYLSPASGGKQLGFRLERDSAENLFIIAEGSGPARLILEFAAPRDAFAGESTAFDWSEIPSSMLPMVPANVKADAETMAKEIGVDKSTQRPGEVIRTLVKYFRDFHDSSDPPASTGDLYLDLARSKKGVCRHRAWAFMITAVGIGLPTRFVFNEAHAWVEVFDGYLWRRVDLGGAGRILDDKTEKPETPQPQFDPPADPYPWPAGATKGSDLVPPSAKTPTPTPTNTAPLPMPTGSSPTPPTNAPPSKVTLTLENGSGDTTDPREVFRSNQIHVKGRLLASDGSACKKVRVEIVLKQAGTGLERIAGQLLTDDAGYFDGSVAIPSDLPLGDYSVTAHTPGAGLCGQGTSE
jgi:transglutaminase-like putative cysteine protease